ncbi:hypothetical protein AAC387_Pa09g0883 [Persea americana]
MFHRSYLDCLIDDDQKTCPICKMPIIPDEMKEAFNELLWATSGPPICMARTHIRNTHKIPCNRECKKRGRCLHYIVKDGRPFV